jgi:hypothetical protein
MKYRCSIAMYGGLICTMLGWSQSPRNWIGRGKEQGGVVCEVHA